MSMEDPDQALSNTQASPSRFLCNVPRKISLFAGLAAIMALIVGAGFANMSASDSPTSLETMVVRWTAMGFLAIAAVAYLIGGRMRRVGGG
jgi:hypothetical protein